MKNHAAPLILCKGSSRFATLEQAMNRLSIKSVISIYTILSCIGLIIGRLKSGLWFFGFTGQTIPDVAMDIVIGAAIAAPVIFLSTISEKIFSQILAPLKTSKIIIIAAASGIGEEIFFRGGLQPILGIVITSILFGLIHFPFKKELIPWTMIAIAMGFVLGLLFTWTDSLIAPITTHFTINFCNILILNRRYRTSRH